MVADKGWIQIFKLEGRKNRRAVCGLRSPASPWIWRLPFLCQARYTLDEQHGTKCNSQLNEQTNAM